MQRILKLDNVFAFSLFVSFFLPWSNRLQGISDGTLTGVDYTFGMFFMLSPILGLAIAIVPVLCIAILIQGLRRHDTSRLRKITSIWTIMLFLLAITYHTVSGVLEGKSFTDSVGYQLSQVCYGVYLALISALCMSFIGRRAR